jgi:hypothetical protein
MVTGRFLGLRILGHSGGAARLVHINVALDWIEPLIILNDILKHDRLLMFGHNLSCG